MNRSIFLRRMALAALMFPLACHGIAGATPSIEDAYLRLGTNPEGLAIIADYARQNNPLAFFYLGVASELGLGTAKHAQSALNYYRAAADKIKEAAFNAGRLLYLDKRVDDAMRYCVVAAGMDRADGIVQAMVLLGRMYERGESSAGRNYVSAYRWYEAAARKKDPVAIGKLGEFLLFGLGRPSNARDARFYIERASDSWNADAQFMMGEAFAKGLFGPVNRTEAAKWFLVAGSRSPDHKRRSEPFFSSLTNLEAQSARRMADLWIGAHPAVEAVDYLGILDRAK